MACVSEYHKNEISPFFQCENTPFVKLMVHFYKQLSYFTVDTPWCFENIRLISPDYKDGYV